jgi:4-aminobutyrate aminotransferase
MTHRDRSYALRTGAEGSALGGEPVVTMAERYRTAIMPVQPMETQLHISHGEGSYLYTTDGRRYLDLATGIAVNAIGYGHREVMEAIEAQVRKHLHLYSGTGYQNALIDYAEAILAEVGDAYKLFFGNSGTEAVEAAIKLARFVTRRPAVIAFRGSFHGRSLGALSLTDSAARYRSPYEPLLPSVYHVPYPAPTRLAMEPAEALQFVQRQVASLLETDVSPDRVALIVLEPIQGEGGYVIPPDGFLPWLRSLADEYGILLAVDEVQSGMGRTGRMFAYQHSDIDPDIVIMGKALGGGMPLSAIAARKEFADAWAPGSHGTTFGGNPVSCAAGLATLRVVKKEHLMDQASRLGALALRKLSPLQNLADVADVRGRGLMVAIEFAGNSGGELAHRVMDDMLAEGVILHTAGLRHQVIRLMPPLNIDVDTFTTALDTLVHVVSEASGEVARG